MINTLIIQSVRVGKHCWAAAYHPTQPALILSPAKKWEKTGQPLHQCYVYHTILWVIQDKQLVCVHVSCPVFTLLEEYGLFSQRLINGSAYKVKFAFKFKSNSSNNNNGAETKLWTSFCVLEWQLWITANIFFLLNNQPKVNEMAIFCLFAITKSGRE